MMFGGLRLLLAAAALAASGVTAVQAQPVSIPIDEVANSDEVRREGDGYRHLPSNFLFPASLGAMSARKLIVYGPANVSIQYTLKGGAAGDGWIDLYVYRKDVGLAEEAAMTEELILEHYAAKRIAAPTGFSEASAGAEGGWYDATIGGKPYLTHYQLSHHGEWAVKARFSMPVGAPADVRDRAAAALAAPPTRWR